MDVDYAKSQSDTNFPPMKNWRHGAIELFTLLILGFTTPFDRTCASEDWINGEEALRERLRKRFGDALGPEVRLNYQRAPIDDFELPMVKKDRAPVEHEVSEADMLQRQAEEEARIERWSRKDLVSELYMASVWTNEFTELTWYREGKFLRAPVNGDLTELHKVPWIETESRVFMPLILPVHVQKDAVNLDADAPDVLVLSEDDLARFGSDLSYLVGYDPAADIGTDTDYNGVEAMLEALDTLATAAEGE